MTMSILLAWAALICGPEKDPRCLVQASQCLYYEYTMNGGDADNAFETCATEIEP